MCRLNRMLHGLQQAPRAKYGKLWEVIQRLAFLKENMTTMFTHQVPNGISTFYYILMICLSWVMVKRYLSFEKAALVI